MRSENNLSTSDRLGAAIWPASLATVANSPDLSNQHYCTTGVSRICRLMT